MSLGQRARDVPGVDRGLNALATLLERITNTIWSFSATLGVIFVLIGLLFLDGVWAGLFGIFGGSFILMAILGVASIRLLRWRYDDR